MIGQPQSHRRRAVVIPTHATTGKRQPQGPMSPMEVVIKELQAHQRIPSVIPLGEGVRFTGEGIESITQGAIEPFDMHSARWLDQHPQRSAGLHRQQSSVLIAMLDGLRQGNTLWNHQAGTPAFAR
jgi:hypothetical protein